MSEDDLEVLITLDDPIEADEEDNFHHLNASNYDASWPGQAPGETPHVRPNPTTDDRVEKDETDNEGPAA